ncbi:MAG: DEAD/DEAH box helicase [Clostridiales bacterium]|nr:DEAD/DEAH box helicase [Clostridiales bacterium]
MSIFDRYAPFIQDFIYRNNWESLRAIQVAAGDAIFHSDCHLLLTASTASGKTEAAFFPILTEFVEDPPRSVGALYIGPLKALINDQFERLNDLCQEAGIPVWHWHGDVSQTHKNKLLKHPSGILQITPESLESLLMHKHNYISTLFSDLRYIVIDEVHSLMRADRGAQTLCLIERLCRLSGADPRRIGLSATIGDPETVAAFLAHGTSRETLVPKIEAKGIRWRLSMEHFYVQRDENEEKGPELLEAAASALIETEPDGDLIPGRPAELALDTPTDLAPRRSDPGLKYIFEHTRGKKCLVFVNSREECEAVTTTLRSYCYAQHEPDRFLIHHGNLSASYRETAETVMKDEEQLQTTVTTATLELGIDIGRLERAFQIDAPFTVSSFLQRMGRTGRRGQPPEMYFVIREDESEPRAMLPETLPWTLLQGIALIQLYLEDRWVEPTRLDRLPFSLLYHQTLCTLASCGELTPKELAARVLTLSPFHRITMEDYRTLLLHLIETEQLQRTDEGGLIVGLAGEREISSYKFLAVFQDSEEFTVRCEGQDIGTIVQPPPVGEKIALAGHVWTVDEIDPKRHLIYCEPVLGKVPAYFGQCAGDIHDRILLRMRKVLEEDKTYPYLMASGQTRLRLARQAAYNSGLLRQPLICLGGQMYCLFPWLGSYSFLALERFLKLRCAARLGLKGLSSSRPYFMQFTMKATPDEFFQVVGEEASNDFDPMELVYPGEVPLFDKYDSFIPEELLRKGFAYGVLDVMSMKRTVLSWCRPLLEDPAAYAQGGIL